MDFADYFKKITFEEFSSPSQSGNEFCSGIPFLWFWNLCNFCDWYKESASPPFSLKVFWFLSFYQSKRSCWQKSRLNGPIMQPLKLLPYPKGNCISDVKMMTSCLKKTVQTEPFFVFIQGWIATLNGFMCGWGIYC